MMLQVTDDRLQELVELSTEDPLPAWAHTIQVPSSDPSASQGKKSIQRNVMSLTGRQLKDRDDGLNMNTVLDGLPRRSRSMTKPVQHSVRSSGDSVGRAG